MFNKIADESKGGITSASLRKAVRTMDTRFSALELRELIDQEFFVLSQAHYERYMRTPDLFAGQEA